ncbi:MAG: PQQ-dependent sugar dehydrogenase [Thermoleophilaceae bacterium]
MPGPRPPEGARRLGLLTILLVLSLSASASAATVPAGFTDAQVTAVGSPTALAFTPDGRMLIATQPGKVRLNKGGELLAAPALDLGSSVCFRGERGLLGIAVDPEFAVNHFIYTFATRTKSDGTCVNRVSRFVLAGDVAALSSEVVLFDNIHSDTSGAHAGGDLHFGNDGYLYVSVGDGYCDYARDSGCSSNNDASRDPHVALGKILRITRDGEVAPGNPYAASGAPCSSAGRTTAGRQCQETFASGLRNPFRFAFDPNTTETRFFINDVGENHWEEIDEGKAGADYGWNVGEGHCVRGSYSNCPAPPPGITNPAFDYGHNTPCHSITGGAFVPAGIWPELYNGAYLYGDYVCGKIFRLEPRLGGGYTAVEFATGLGTSSAVALAFGPHDSAQALYYTSYAKGGEVRRIAHTETINRTPIAQLSASPSSGTLPLVVTLDGIGSSDPDGDSLTYIWDYGDGTPTSETATSSVTHAYETAGAYTATLRVRDSRGALSDSVTARIDAGNTPPAPTIEAPRPDLRFVVGQELTLRGSATDQEDGALADSSLTWEILRHHNEHTHPFMPATSGNGLSLTAPGPEDLPAAETSYLEVRLTATDSQGASETVIQELRPALVRLSFASEPSGLELRADGTAFTTPQTFTSWQGYALSIEAPAQTGPSGGLYEFDSWSDGGAARHTIETPDSDSTYEARFTESQAGLLGEYFDGVGLTGSTVTRTDATVDFNWGRTEGPIPEFGADTFSVRWTGRVEPLYSETYSFYTNSDDGVRLWVDGKLIVGNWGDHAVAENSGTVALTAGQRYDIQLEYYENRGAAVARLGWSSASQAREVIPQGRLEPGAGG